MAKFKRFDPSNKKANKHKSKTRDGSAFRKIKSVEPKHKRYEKDI